MYLTEYSIYLSNATFTMASPQKYILTRTKAKEKSYHQCHLEIGTALSTKTIITKSAQPGQSQTV